MNLDPTLSQTDRIGSFVIGVALIGAAFLGGFETAAAQVLVVAVGAAFAVGGVGGT